MVMSVPHSSFASLPPFSTHSAIGHTGLSLSTAELFSPPSRVLVSHFPKHVCVTVLNHGPGPTQVRLFKDDHRVGEFLVFPAKLSSICSQLTAIEFQCTHGRCKAGWRVHENEHAF